ncbi:hypothetical protein [Corynebacterium sp. UBA4397]|uniref:hypothetical protein n=1 Tax=Corynebacterium sp. UBA4397 TaxID=1946394 RepID=UPI00257F5FD4|nr:hypothetical protein [Corynebacterium sp. UBA4397]
MSQIAPPKLSVDTGASAEASQFSIVVFTAVTFNSVEREESFAQPAWALTHSV